MSAASGAVGRLRAPSMAVCLQRTRTPWPARQTLMAALTLAPAAPAPRAAALFRSLEAWPCLARG
jgi:hypothetical protein